MNSPLHQNSGIDSEPTGFESYVRLSGPVANAASASLDRRTCRSALRALNQAFGDAFSLVDVRTGKLLYGQFEGLNGCLYNRLALLSEIASRGKPEFAEEVAPVVVLAVPLRALPGCESLLAIGVFLCETVHSEAEIAAAAQMLGLDAQRAYRWAAKRQIWPTQALVRLADTVIENLVQRRQIIHLQHELNEAVAEVRDAYVELGLLHRLTRHLHLCSNESELLRNALEWLADSVPAQCLAIVANRSERDGNVWLPIEDHDGVLVQGQSPVYPAELRRIVESFDVETARHSLVLNRSETSLPTWNFPAVRELACVPIEDGDRPLGWILALNCTNDDSDEIGRYGSVELRLLSSVGTMLGIHSSNSALYQQQAELFSSAVRALTTAIDAKDRYTAGHSDRVARVSVLLARELGVTKEIRDTVYLGGLLHDIGKIGIDDQVLNKSTNLTPEEFEHIKLHPQLGYDILKGVQRLEQILPIVLHHHEAWNGSGYPHGLEGAECPLMARIVAVADSFDAMSSDRPYRKGMNDMEIDEILLDGRGTQWDPEIIDAFFSIREEIRIESQRESADYSLEGTHWVR